MALNKVVHVLGATGKPAPVGASKNEGGAVGDRSTPGPGEGPSSNGLSAHILPTSATMIGVCMTVLSIGHLGPRGEMRMVLDKLLAIDALIFLVSAGLSFLSMRSHGLGVRHESRAEGIFIAGLGLLALIAMGLAFAIT